MVVAVAGDRDERPSPTIQPPPLAPPVMLQLVLDRVRALAAAGESEPSELLGQRYSSVAVEGLHGRIAEDVVALIPRLAEADAAGADDRLQPSAVGCGGRRRPRGRSEGCRSSAIAWSSTATSPPRRRRGCASIPVGGHEDEVGRLAAAGLGVEDAMAGGDHDAAVAAVDGGPRADVIAGFGALRDREEDLAVGPDAGGARIGDRGCLPATGRGRLAGRAGQQAGIGGRARRCRRHVGRRGRIRVGGRRGARSGSPPVSIGTGSAARIRACVQ